MGVRAGLASNEFYGPPDRLSSGRTLEGCDHHSLGPAGGQDHKHVFQTATPGSGNVARTARLPGMIRSGPPLSASLVDLDSRTQSRLNRPLYPRVRVRRVLTSQVDSTLGLNDPLVKQPPLTRFEERKAAAGERIVVPRHRGAAFELGGSLRMDPGKMPK
jgi:hypothetical protein